MRVLATAVAVIVPMLDRRMTMVVQVFGFGGFAVFAAVAFEQAADRQLFAGYARVEQVEDALVETEMCPEAESDLRILLAQALDLRLDALNQHAGKQIHRHDDDLHHAELDLPLHDRLQPRPGDASEGEVDEFVFVCLEDPARHACQFAVGAGVRRTAPEQNDAGRLRVGNGERLHLAVELRLQDGEQLAPHAKVTRHQKLDLRVA